MGKIFKKILSLGLGAIMTLALVPTKTFADTSSDWVSISNNIYNNAVTDRPMPTMSFETSLKWATKDQSIGGWSATMSPAIIVNGYLYSIADKYLYKIDRQTGQILGQSKSLPSATDYATIPPFYGGGKIFVALNGGVIVALDPDTLDELWETPNIGGQSIAPLRYQEIDGKGYIYQGTWHGEQKDGVFFCATADDSNLVEKSRKMAVKKDGKYSEEMVTYKEKQLLWGFIPSGDESSEVYQKFLSATNHKVPVTSSPNEMGDENRGFYWAGAYGTDKYIAIISDDGAKGSDGELAGLYTLNPKTGEIIDSSTEIQGDSRSGIVYNDGYIYFTSKGGYLYKYKISDDGELEDSGRVKIGRMSTGTPIVYKGRIYVGAAGEGKDQFSPDSGHTFVVVNDTEELDDDSLAYKVPIPGYPQAQAILSTAYENEDFNNDGKPDGRVYLVFTYNAPPGGIYAFYDEPGSDTPKEVQELFLPPKDKQQHAISTIAVDKEGVLYYKNDKGYLMAVSVNRAYIRDAQFMISDSESLKFGVDKSGSPAKFDPRKMEYKLEAKEDTESLKLRLNLPEGAVAVVDGRPYTKDMTINLPNPTNTVVISVDKGPYHRDYTFNILKPGTDTSLSTLRLTKKNSFTDYDVDIFNSEDKPNEYSTELRSSKEDYYAMWVVPTDEKATVKVYPIENVSPRTVEEGVLKSKVNNGEEKTFYPLSFEDDSKNAVYKIEVTSGNGKFKEEYFLTVKKEKDITVESITVTNEFNSILDIGEKGKLKAEIEPENAVNKNLLWISLDPNVISVDEKTGEVTAKAVGQADIKCTSVDKGATTTVTLKVVDKAAELKALNNKKAEAKTEISKLANLEEKDKKDFLKKVEEANDISAVEQVLANAKAKDGEIEEAKRQKAEALKAKKADAKQTIEALTNLEEGDKTPFLTRVEEATEINAIDPVVAEAKAKDAEIAKNKEDVAQADNKLKEAKSKAAEAITKATNISPEDKRTLIAKVNEAKSLDEVAKIEETSHNLFNSMTVEGKEFFFKVEGNLPAGTRLQVSKVSSKAITKDEVINSIKSAISKEDLKKVDFDHEGLMFDVNLVDNQGHKVEPTGENPITLTFNLGNDNGGKTFVVVHKKDSGEVEGWKKVADDNGKVSLTVTSLSPINFYPLVDKIEDNQPNDEKEEPKKPEPANPGQEGGEGGTDKPKPVNPDPTQDGGSSEPDKTKPEPADPGQQGGGKEEATKPETEKPEPPKTEGSEGDKKPEATKPEATKPAQSQGGESTGAGTPSTSVSGNTGCKPIITGEGQDNKKDEVVISNVPNKETSKNVENKQIEKKEKKAEKGVKTGDTSNVSLVGLLAGFAAILALMLRKKVK